MRRTWRVAALILLLAAAVGTEARLSRWHPPLLPRKAQLYRERDMKQRRLFMIITGYPNGRPGYQIDHRIPLKRGGCDAWWNMQWLTTAEKKAKDRIE